jgi:hypothetical protein
MNARGTRGRLAVNQPGERGDGTSAREDGTSTREIECRRPDNSLKSGPLAAAAKDLRYKEVL